MPSKTGDYRDRLRGLEPDDLEDFLREHSGLPGPRGNLELADAVADVGDLSTFRRLARFDPAAAPTNTPGEFLAFCGVLGIGEVAATGRPELIDDLRSFASDPRWRIREAVARGLQRVGEADMDLLLDHMTVWSRGSPLEQRAAAAALSEPKLLTDGDHVGRVLDVLDDITESVLEAEDRSDDAFRVLRQGLGYCWSVAVAADPEVGKARMAAWFGTDDPDVRWLMRENLRKKRLERMVPAWVERGLEAVTDG